MTELLDTRSIKYRSKDAGTYKDGINSNKDDSLYKDTTNLNKDNDIDFDDSKNKQIEYIWSNIIGITDTIETPFGTKKLLYTDYTASGKGLKNIEEYIYNEVLPMYANTHTISSSTGIQSTEYRKESRDIVHRYCRGSNEDIAQFCGTGSTSCISTILRILRIKEIVQDSQQNNKKKPIIFLSIIEHHSNILPWKEVGADIVIIPIDPITNYIDTNVLENELIKYNNEGRWIIGSFSACSNVTGVVQDTIYITELQHKYNGICIWDYASSASHGDIDMNPNNIEIYKKDILFFSLHKFIGGISTPGIIVIKKKLFSSNISQKPGGGTVLFVTPNKHLYTSNIEEREEGGTQDIIGSIRSGQILQMYEQITKKYIKLREEYLLKRVQIKLKDIPNLEIFHPLNDNSIGILSFVIRYELDKNIQLHHNYICILLSDLFGIQMRSGCMCAGPYIQYLLNITDINIDKQYTCAQEGMEIFRPGLIRFNINFFYMIWEIDYICKCIHWISINGWKLLPLYIYKDKTGEFYHRIWKDRKPIRRWIGDITYTDGYMNYTSKRNEIVSLYNNKDIYDIKEKTIEIFIKQLQDADELQINLSNIMNQVQNVSMYQHNPFTENLQRQRWFLLPEEAQSDLQQRTDFTKTKNLYNINKDNIFTINNNISQKYRICMLEKYLQEYIIKNIWIPQIDTNDTKIQIKNFSRILQREQDILLYSKPIHKDSIFLEGDKISIFASPITDLRSISNTINTTTSNNINDTKEIIQIKDIPICNIVKKDKTNKLTSTCCQYCFHEHILKIYKGTYRPGECIFCQCTSFLPLQDQKNINIKKCMKNISKLVGKAIKVFKMINEGDRILVGISGGKDSQTLITIQLYLQKRSPIKFELGAATVDPMTPEYDPSILKEYFASIDVEYYYISQPIIQQAKILLNTTNKQKKNTNELSICAYCSRMKRGILYTTARKYKYNVLALGQHLDDISESFLMSVFYNGQLQTMKANYINRENDIRIIRPQCFVRETKTREFSKLYNLPIIIDNCPACFSEPKERQRMKQLLAQQETIHPLIHQTILRAVMPLLSFQKADSCVYNTPLGDIFE